MQTLRLILMWILIQKQTMILTLKLTRMLKLIRTLRQTQRSMLTPMLRLTLM